MNTMTMESGTRVDTYLQLLEEQYVDLFPKNCETSMLRTVYKYFISCVQGIISEDEHASILTHDEHPSHKVAREVEEFFCNQISEYIATRGA